MGWQPEGYARILPYLTVDDPEAAIAWYGRVFGAEPTLRLNMGGKIGHAEIRIGDAHVMLSGEWPQIGRLGPKALGGTPTALTLYVPDVDAVVAAAVEGGATVEWPVADQFYGDRSGTILDPFGHRWSIHTHQRTVSEADMQAAMDAMMQQQAASS
jgi:PhnB protein